MERSPMEAWEAQAQMYLELNRLTSLIREFTLLLIVVPSQVREQIQRETKLIMAAIDDLNTKVDGLVTDLAGFLTTVAEDIADLKAACGATPDQRAALGQKIDVMDTTVKSFSACV